MQKVFDELVRHALNHDDMPFLLEHKDRTDWSIFHLDEFGPVAKETFYSAWVLSLVCKPPPSAYIE